MKNLRLKTTFECETFFGRKLFVKAGKSRSSRSVVTKDARPKEAQEKMIYDFLLIVGDEVEKRW